jgi:hypothetical protein
MNYETGYYVGQRLTCLGRIVDISIFEVIEQLAELCWAESN